MTIMQILVPLITALFAGGSVFAAFKVGPERRRMGADTARVVADTAVSLLGPFERQIGTLEEQLVRYQHRITEITDQYEKRIRELTDQVSAAGAELEHTRRQLALERRDAQEARLELAAERSRIRPVDPVVGPEV